MIGVLGVEPAPSCSVVRSPFERFILDAPHSAVDHFFSWWTADAIWRLSRISSSVQLGVERYAMRAWDVRSSLGHWFKHVPVFLETLDSCDGIVAGWHAQKYLDRVRLPSTDLDIYVPAHALHRMGRWLQQEGLFFVPFQNQHSRYDVAALLFASSAAQYTMSDPTPSEPVPAPYSIFHFVRPFAVALPHDAPGGRHVRLVGVRGHAVDFLINNSHSSKCAVYDERQLVCLLCPLAAGLNYITGTCGVSLFPRTTFLDRLAYVCRDVVRNADIHLRWKQEHQQYGLTVVTAQNACLTALGSLVWARKVGDRLTWILPHDRSRELFANLAQTPTDFDSSNRTSTYNGYSGCPV